MTHSEMALFLPNPPKKNLVKSFKQLQEDILAMMTNWPSLKLDSKSPGLNREKAIENGNEPRIALKLSLEEHKCVSF